MRNAMSVGRMKSSQSSKSEKIPVKMKISVWIVVSMSGNPSRNEAFNNITIFYFLKLSTKLEKTTKKRENFR
jgi:hypothetical protein